MIYSFDIFDTLLLRPCIEPQEVWRMLEEQEAAKGFVYVRRKADSVTYRKATEENRETTIEEAYLMMPNRFKHLLPKEMELERKILEANPEMLQLWNELGNRGERRIIVSDMYLPASFVKSVLQEKGFSGWDGFYLSSERNARKTTGELFKIMLKEQGTEPEEVCHTGDNEWSDVKIPQQLGMKVNPYKKISERLFADFPFMKLIDKRLAGALALGWHSFKLDNPNPSFWNKMGFSMAGVISYTYIKWISEISKIRGIDRLLFVARDGYILQKICYEILPEMNTCYFYAPRLTSIAVLGATGSDPIAIEDRKQYMKKHLRGIDSEQVRNNYALYIRQFDINEKTAIVDGCSSGFSAQRLVEAAIGHEVFTFYLHSMASMHHAGALYSTKGYSLPFQMLLEFMLGSPEPPIKDVKDNKPEYVKQINPDEKYKMSVSDEITLGALACARSLQKYDIKIKASDWLLFTDKFINNISEADRSVLEKSKNAGDVEQKHFMSTLWRPYRKVEFWMEKWGRATFYFNLILFSTKCTLKIGRNITLSIKNMKPKFYLVEE